MQRANILKLRWLELVLGKKYIKEVKIAHGKLAIAIMQNELDPGKNNLCFLLAIVVLERGGQG